MQTNTTQPAPQNVEGRQYNLQRDLSGASDKPNFVLMVSENGEKNVACPTDNNILITINDVDDKGNIVNSEIVDTNEIKIVDSLGSEDGRSLRRRKACNKK